MSAALPIAELHRLQALRALDIPPSDPVLDGLVRVAAHGLGCPVAVVSLVDQDRQWFPARFGTALTEIRRDIAFCTHTLLAEDLFVVPDAAADPRFAANPLVRAADPGIRFYAGLPLRLDGLAIGALCVTDTAPRTLDAAQCRMLEDLGRAVEHWMATLRTQRQLQEREQELIELAEQVPGVVYRMVLTPCPRLLYVGPQLAGLGHSPQDWLGRPNAWSDALHPDDRLAVLRRLQAACADGQALEQQYRLADGQGGWRHVRDTLRHTGQRHEGAAVLQGVWQDVTAQVQAGEQVDELVAQRTAELDAARSAAEAANASKTDFLASMSHEIRTPMNGVLGIVDVLQKTRLTTYQRELADTIAESGQVLLALIDDVLDLTKIEAGRLSLADEPVALLPLVEAMTDSLQALAIAKGVDLHTFVDPLLPAAVRSDAVRLRQIGLNLLGNGIKFSSGLARRGRVSMRLLPGDAGGLRLVVRDNGIGVDEATRVRLFEPFAQGVNAVSRSAGGTGLGLAITRRIVQAMGGTIELADPVGGVGACFVVELPLPAAAAPAAPAWDLQGVACALSLKVHGAAHDREREADWARWLVAAGATLVDAETHVPAGPAVLVTTTGGDGPPPDAAWRQVRVGHGQRHRPRHEGGQHVGIDLQGLHCDSLLHAVALAAGRCAWPVPEPDAPLESSDAPLPDRELAGQQGRLLLVAEDNPINRRVIAHQLRRLGLAADLVGDGQTALDLWRQDPARYGLLLTDLQMPRIDGAGLVAAIRAEEGPARRLPIIALTAGVLGAAGPEPATADVDEQLGKPISIAALSAALGRWLPPAVPATPTAPPTATATPRLAAVDDAALELHVGPDRALQARVVHSYIQDARATAEQIVHEVSAGDLWRAAALAHRLKSSSQLVGAAELVDALNRLEQAGRVGDQETASALAARVIAAAAVATAVLDSRWPAALPPIGDTVEQDAAPAATAPPGD